MYTVPYCMGFIGWVGMNQTCCCIIMSGDPRCTGGSEGGTTGGK